MDDVWCNKNKKNNEKNFEDNLKTLKNELQKKPSNPINNLLYNKFPFSTFFKKNDFNIKTINNNNFNNRKNINLNNFMEQKYNNNSNNSFYIQSNYSNNLINFNKYNTIQIESTISTSSDTKTTSQESNNYQIIKKYLNQNDINKYCQTTQNNFYYTFYNNNSNFTLNNYNNNNNIVNSTFPNSNIQNTNFLNDYYSSSNIFLNNNSNNLMNNDNEYIINIKDIIEGKEKRTSIRIKNIPIKYSNQDLMKEIDLRMNINKNINYRNYDLIYLPMNYSNTRNLGYAFINFIHPICIIDFFNKFKEIKFKNNNKECQITFAKYQGKKEITSHLFNSSGEGKKPFLFNINKNKVKIRISKKYFHDIQKFTNDIFHLIEFYD